jgi:hypothetical protein
MSQLGQYGSLAGGAINTLTGNVGGNIGPLGGNVNIVGAGIVTVTGNPATNTLTITSVGGAGTVTALHPDAGADALPTVLGVINVLGGANIATASAANTINVALIASPSVAGSLTAGTYIRATLGNIVTTNGSFIVGSPANAALANNITLQKDRAGAIIVAGDPLGSINFSGYDGAAYHISSRITSTCPIGTTVAAGRVASDLQFYTSPDAVGAAISRMAINSSGNVTIFTPDAGLGLEIIAGGMEVDAGSLVVAAGNIGINETVNDAACNALYFYKSRVGAIVHAADDIGKIDFVGFDGVGGQIAARILASVPLGTTPGVGRVPSELSFWTTPDAISAVVERVLISDAGNVTIFAPDAGVGLQINNGGMTIAAGNVTITPFGWGAVISNGTGVLSSQTPGLAGTVLTSNGVAAAPTWQAAAIGITWSREIGTPVAIVANHGYVQANAGVGLTTFTLPAAAALGTTIEIIGESAGGWVITQAAGQSIQMGNVSTTVGAGGSLWSTNRYDTVTLRCRVVDTTWSVVAAVGNLVAA